MNRQASIWILTDDDPLIAILMTMLQSEDWGVRMFGSTAECAVALNASYGEKPDLVIARIATPDVSVVEILQSDFGTTLVHNPVIVLSDVQSPDIRRVCFGLGGLDYIIMPFPMEELMVKMRRILSRPSVGTVDVESIALDPVTMTATCGRLVSPSLTSKEYQILSRLVVSRNRPTPRDEIINSVWNSTKIGPKTIDVHICNLRRKLTYIDLDIRACPPSDYLLTTTRPEPTRAR